MSYIFLDESGDLGFNFKNSKTTKFFVLVFLFVKNKRSMEKITRKIFNGFTKMEMRNHPGGVLHCFKESPKVRTRLLNLFSQGEDGEIITIYLNKRKVYTTLQDQKHILYNYVTNILLDRVCTKKLLPVDRKIYLVASRRETNKVLNDNFKSYLKAQILNNHKVDIEVQIAPPHAEKGLQVADFASWSVFRKHEHNDESYYNLIKRKIVEENPLFPG